MQPKQALAGRMTLAGSERAPVSNAEDRGPVDPDQQAEVTIYLKSKMPEGEIDKLINEISTEPVSERKYLSREQLAELRGASPESVTCVEAFAREYHLKIVRSDPASRTISLCGSLGDLQKAFGVALRNYQSAGTSFRARSGCIFLPADVAPAIEGVFGLDTRPLARPR
jgi:kumamolisin